MGAPGIAHGMNTLEQLREKLVGVWPHLVNAFGVATIDLFGSFVRGEATQASDLDVLVTFSRPPDLFEFLELENFLSDSLGVRVDLVLKESLKPQMGEMILREAVPV